MTYHGFDFYEIDSLFSKEELEIRNTAREFLNKEVKPYIEKYYQKDEFPRDLPKKFGEMGFLGSTIQGYGCPGWNYTSYGLLMQEIERVDSGIRSFASVQGALVMYPIASFGSESLKEKYLPKLASGEWVGCFGLTEANHGSNPSNMETTARLEGDRYILNGKKRWLTNGSISDVAMIWAKDESDGKVIGLVVDTALEGVHFKTIKEKFSLRASISSEVEFQNCKVPKENALEVKGLKGPFSCLNIARYGISWGVIGAAQECLQTALEYTKTRKQFHDKPLASHQLVQKKLVDSFCEITKAQLMNYRLGRLMDDKKAKPPQISMAKMNHVSMTLDIARKTRDLLGANGITYDYPIGRHLMNLESVNTYEGTEDIHRLILGQYLTGESAF